MFFPKYIIVERVLPIVFNSSIEHADEAANREVKSAGFCNIYTDESGEIQVKCWGESTSLGGLKSRPEIDAKLIKNMLLGE